MKLNQFNYAVPEDLIAQRPLRQRDQARLMVVDRQAGAISHDVFFNIGKYLPSQSLIILNDSKVLPVRLLGRREVTGGEVEIFLLKELSNGRWQALLRPLKRLRPGDRIVFGGSRLVATIEDRENRIVSFNVKDPLRYLPKIGHVPLPPYIKRGDDPADRKDYQTVYAKHAGSVASPTAGLHFTKPLLTQLQKSGHLLGAVTLHVNYATFQPVEAEDVISHPMHEEEYNIPTATLTKIQKAKEHGQKIVAVGTTSCRVLESYAASGRVSGSTKLFIYPGYKFKMVDILVTNFHQPLTTLLMLVYAFGEESLVKRAYQEAIAKKYRLFSYGDAMIIK